MDKIGFPSLGSAIRYIFKSTGVEANSRGENSFFKEEKEKKTFQTILKRLADETGTIPNNLKPSIAKLFEVISNISPTLNHSLAIIEGLFACLHTYSSAVKEEGTYLNEKNSLRYILETKLLNQIAMYQALTPLKFNLKSDKDIKSNDTFWYLPDIEGEEITWPLSKVLKWIYESNNTTLSRFHCPDEDIAELNGEQNRKLAYEWQQGKKPRSWAIIHSVFEQSFEALAQCEIEEFNHKISNEQKKNITFYLFISNLITNIGKDILSAYGFETLKKYVQDNKKDFELLSNGVDFLETSILNDIRKRELTTDTDINNQWYKNINYVQHKVNERYNKIYKELARNPEHINRLKSEKHNLSSNNNSLLDSFDSYILESLIRELKYTDQYQPDRNFPIYLKKGQELKRAAASSSFESADTKIETYKSELENNGLLPQLEWLYLWIKAKHLYKKENYSEAYGVYDKAFNSAKYSAGKLQYELVNEFIESSAKADKFVPFKKAIAWASFLGIKVRLIRNFPQNEKDLKKWFKTFKLVHYI